jgi:hypothetical protein
LPSDVCSKGHCFFEVFGGLMHSPWYSLIMRRSVVDLEEKRRLRRHTDPGGTSRQLERREYQIAFLRNNLILAKYRARN